MKNTLSVVFLLWCGVLWGQDSSSTVIIHKDPRVDLLIRKQAEINVASRKASGYTTRGYRLMVMNTNNREEAIAAKTKIYTYYPELKAYLIYKAPYFKLKAGNFKSKEEAERYRKYLSVYFPKGVFIISDTIEVAPEKESGDE
jgi:SPOR domain